MDKVYVLKAYDNESDWIDSIHSTKEKAEIARTIRIADNLENEIEGETFYIREYEVR
jgi:hypothetical protein